MRRTIIKFLIGMFLITGVSLVSPENQAISGQKDPVTNVRPKQERSRDRLRKHKKSHKKKMHKKNMHKRLHKRIHRNR